MFTVFTILVLLVSTRISTKLKVQLKLMGPPLGFSGIQCWNQDSFNPMVALHETLKAYLLQFVLSGQSNPIVVPSNTQTALMVALEEKSGVTRKNLVVR